MLYQRIFNEHTRLQEQINQLQDQLKQLPEGKLICSKGNNCYKWYVSDGRKNTYLPKREKKTAEQLAVKKYLTLKSEDLLHEKRALEFYLKHHCSDTGKAEYLLQNHPGYSELLAPYFSPHAEQLVEWMNAPYEHNPQFPENLKHKTSLGICVRSKSESMILHALYTNHIPFRYECALHLSEITLYPDFTIRHPITDKIYYWEHFGRMDDTQYAKNVSSKLHTYILHEIIPSIQLITTYETRENPLSYEEIERIITHFFLT